MNDSLVSKVRGLFAGHFGMAPDRSTDESRLRDDLGADRFDRIEFVIAVEDQLAGVEIDDGRRDHRIKMPFAAARESPPGAEQTLASRMAATLHLLHSSSRGSPHVT
jgi:acyl carrier protein